MEFQWILWSEKNHHWYFWKKELQINPAYLGWNIFQFKGGYVKFADYGPIN